MIQYNATPVCGDPKMLLLSPKSPDQPPPSFKRNLASSEKGITEFERLTALFTEAIEKKQNEDDIKASIKENANNDFPPSLRAIAYESEKVFLWSLEAFKYPFPHVSQAHAKDQPWLTPLNAAVYTIQPRMIRHVIQNGGAIDTPSTFRDTAIKTDKIVRGIMHLDDNICLAQPRWLPPYNSYLSIDPLAIDSFLKHGTALWVEHEVREGIHYFAIVKGELFDVRSFDSVACIINRLLLKSMLQPELLTNLPITEEFIIKLDTLVPADEKVSTLRSVSLHALYTLSKELSHLNEDEENYVNDGEGMLAEGTEEDMTLWKTRRKVLVNNKYFMKLLKNTDDLEEFNPTPSPPSEPDLIETFKSQTSFSLMLEFIEAHPECIKEIESEEEMYNTLVCKIIYCKTPSYSDRDQTLNLDSAKQSSIEALRAERGGPSPNGKGEEEARLNKAGASQNSKFDPDRSISKKEQYSAVELLYIALSTGKMSGNTLKDSFSYIYNNKNFSWKFRCILCAVASTFGGVPSASINLFIREIEANSFSLALRKFTLSFPSLNNIHTSEEFLFEIENTTKEINFYLKGSSLSQDRIPPLEKIESWKNMADSIGRLSYDPNTMMEAKNYEKFIDLRIKFFKEYNQLISSHPFLQYLDDIENISNIESDEENNRALIYHEIFTPSYPVMKVLPTAWHKLFPSSYENLRHNLFKLMRRAFSSPQLRSSYRTFFHGTKTGAIEAIFKMRVPSLKSARKLIEEEEPFFNGEASDLHSNAGAIRAIISGQISHPYLPLKSNVPQHRYFSRTRLGDVCIYARSIQMGGPLVTNLEKTEQRFSVKHYKELFEDINNKQPEILENVFLAIRADFVRLREYGKLTEEKVEIFKEEFKDWCLNNSDLEEHQNQIGIIENLLAKPLPKEFKKIGSVNENIPVVLGIPLSKAYRPLNAFHYILDDKEGTDLRINHAVRLIFCDHHEHFETSECFSQLSNFKNIEVHEIASAQFHELWHGLNSEAIDPSNRLCYNTHKEALDTLGNLIQSQVLPYYTYLYPENPSYIDENGDRIFFSFESLNPLENNKPISYCEYRKLVEEGKIVARETHGLLHAARTALWSQAIAILYDQHSQLPKDVNMILLGLAAGLHSAGREADHTKNLWTKESGMMAWECIEKFDCLRDVPDKGELFFNAIEQGASFAENIEKAIIHDANVLEQFRKQGFTADQFSSGRLYISRLIDSNKLNAFIDEIKEFIQLTEMQDFKLKMEYEVKEKHFEKLLELIMLHRAFKGRFKCLSDLFFSGVFNDTPWPKHLEKSSKIMLCRQLVMIIPRLLMVDFSPENLAAYSEAKLAVKSREFKEAFSILEQFSDKERAYACCAFLFQQDPIAIEEDSTKIASLEWIKDFSFIPLLENPERDFLEYFMKKRKDALEALYNPQDFRSMLLLFKLTPDEDIEYEDIKSIFNYICGFLKILSIENFKDFTTTDGTLLKLLSRPFVDSSIPLPNNQEKILSMSRVKLYTSTHKKVKEPLSFDFKEQPNQNKLNITIIIPIANCAHLKFSNETLPEIFHLINQFTLCSPYAHQLEYITFYNKKVHRPNHNGTHSARQARYLEVLLELFSQEGNEKAKKLTQELNSLEKLNLLLGAYLLRSGRVNEISFTAQNSDDYASRSGKIYCKYAEQLKIDPEAIEEMNQLIGDTGRPPTEYLRANHNERSKFIFDCLETVHQLDLIRCFTQSNMEKFKEIVLPARLKKYFGDKAEELTKALFNFAHDLCLATGSPIIANNIPMNIDLFGECSLDGKFCWEQVHRVQFEFKQEHAIIENTFQ